MGVASFCRGRGRERSGEQRDTQAGYDQRVDSNVGIMSMTLASSSASHDSRKTVNTSAQLPTPALL